jgi:hypothetical protein
MNTATKVVVGTIVVSALLVALLVGNLWLA